MPSLNKNKLTVAFLTLLIMVSIIVIVLKTTVYMGIATFTYTVMVTGLIYRKQIKPHSFLMSIALFLDIALVLLLQIKRDAIQTAASFNLDFLQQIHIFSSLSAVVLYLPALYLGWSLFYGKLTHLKDLHIKIGIVAFILRSIGFLTMFSLLSHVK